MLTILNTLENVETMLWLNKLVYLCPTFFTMQSMRYRIGSLTSVETCVEKT